MHDVSVHHLAVDGHQCPEVNVNAMWVETNQRQDVEEELGPKSQVLHDEGECKHLSCFVLDEGLLRLDIHQLFWHKTEKCSD